MRENNPLYCLFRYKKEVQIRGEMSTLKLFTVANLHFQLKFRLFYCLLFIVPWLSYWTYQFWLLLFKNKARQHYVEHKSKQERMQNIFKSEQNATQITIMINENRAGRKRVSKLKRLKEEPTQRCFGHSVRYSTGRSWSVNGNRRDE